MTHPLHRLADTTLRMFIALMVADDRSPLTEAQRSTVRVYLKDATWRVGRGGPVPIETLESWYDTLQRQWKHDIHSGDIGT
jgi:hypothetical protein